MLKRRVLNVFNQGTWRPDKFLMKAFCILSRTKKLSPSERGLWMFKVNKGSVAFKNSA